MKFHVVRAEDLVGGLADSWRRIRSAEPTLDSPYFALDFTTTVAKVRNNVEIAVVEDGGGPVAFLPFERTRRGLGLPIGGILNDFHGLIAAPGLEIDLQDLLRACGLVAWDFHAVVADQSAFRQFGGEPMVAPYFDLSGGAESYWKQRKEQGTANIQKLPKKRRRLNEEVGPIRLETDSRDNAAFDKLVEWKSQNYFKTGAPNVFKAPGVLPILRLLWEDQSLECAGRLSVLRAGDELVAVLLSMQSGVVWHTWFQGYELEFARYSPGLLHYEELVPALDAIGIKRIDTGYGDEAYKPLICTAASKVVAGSVEVPTAATAVRKLGRSVRSAVRTSKLYQYVKPHWLRAKAWLNRRANADHAIAAVRH